MSGGVIGPPIGKECRWRKKNLWSRPGGDAEGGAKQKKKKRLTTPKKLGREVNESPMAQGRKKWALYTQKERDSMLKRGGVPEEA